MRGWAGVGVGACSTEGVGDGPDPAGGRFGHHSRCSAPAWGAMPDLSSKAAQWSISLPSLRCCRRFGALTPTGPSEGVKQHNGRFSYRVCDVAVGLAPLTFSRPDFRYTKISARPGSGFVYTNFSGGRGFPLGGDVEEIGYCQRKKIRSHGTSWYHFFTSLLIVCGGDLDKNGRFS